MASIVALRHCFLLKNLNIFQATEKVIPCLFAAAREIAHGREKARSYCVSSAPRTEDEKDRVCRQHEKLFSSSRVQQILLQITSFDVNKIYQPKQGPLRPPRYKFMTDEELKQAREEAEDRGHQKLKMPPFLRCKEIIPCILSKDPEIQGLIPNNLVCVDISPGQHNRSRVIVVREPGGILREANQNERVRTNQAYFPKEGRQVDMPSMFQPAHLENVLKRGDFLFALERACCQFEQDDPQYARVTESTFRYIAQTKNFDVLRSTRHFGPMAFFLVIEKNVEGLMIEMIQRLLVDDAVNLVELHCLVHFPEKWDELAAIQDKVQVLKVFAAEHYKNSELELLVQSLKEHLKQEQVRN